MMEGLFFEFAVRATLIVGSAAILLYAMRVKEAEAKHHIWTGVLVLMLLLPIWMLWGPKASLRVLPPLSQATASKARIPIEGLETGAARSNSMNARLAVALGAYLLGLLLLLFRLGIGTMRSRRLVRAAVLQNGVLTSASCAAPVTVGLLRPRVVLPDQWEQWPKAQFDAVLIHESEHVRRRHPLIQWLALLNRALFWFHPVAWWLERHLASLAEETCDNIVLARGYDPRAYAGYLVEMARSVKRSGVRIDIASLTMPGSSLPRRIRRILEVGYVSRMSTKRVALVSIACVITCSAIAAGSLDRAEAHFSGTRNVPPQQTGTATQPAAKLVLRDIKIEGDVDDREGVRERVLSASKSRSYDSRKDLTDEAGERIRADFQERGYFKAIVEIPSLQPLGLTDGKQSIRAIASVTEGNQYRLKSISFESALQGRTLSFSAATLRDQFHLREGDLFNITQIRQGLVRLRQLYLSRGYASFAPAPNTLIDTASHRIDLKISITEGPHTP